MTSSGTPEVPTDDLNEAEHRTSVVASRGKPLLENLRELWVRYAVVIFLVVLVVVFSFLAPDTFASIGNLRAIVNGQAILLLLTATATITLRAGEFDLSIASTMALSASAAAVLSSNGSGPALVIAAGLAVGAVVGFTNGFLIVRLGVGSLIATLGMFTLLGGVSLLITDSRLVVGIPEYLTSAARTRVFGFSLTTFYAWGVILALWYVYERTPLGRHLLFVGGGRDVARLAGLRVDRLRIGVFVASGLMASLIGILLVGTLGSMDPSIGGQYLLQPFAAAFLGATTIKPGRFNAIGAMLGLYLIAVGVTGLLLLGADRWVADVFNGTTLIVAVALASLTKDSK